MPKLCRCWGSTAPLTTKPSFGAISGVLLNHDGNHQRTIINKAAAADDATVVFQTGFSSRALVGLLGDDALRIKVSQDGSAFLDAIEIDAADGGVTFPSGLKGTGSTAGSLGGQIIAFSGEENNALSPCKLQSMGNGAQNAAGATMPFPGRVLAASMSISSGSAGLNIVSMAINRAEQTAYQVSVNYSGSGVNSGYSDFFLAPLTFVAGDALNMIANISSGAEQVVTTFFVAFD